MADASSFFLALLPEMRAEVAGWLGRRDAYALALSCGAGLCAAEAACTLALLTLPRQWQDVVTGRRRHWYEEHYPQDDRHGRAIDLVRLLVHNGIEIGVLDGWYVNEWSCVIHYNQTYSIWLYDEGPELKGHVRHTLEKFNSGVSPLDFYRKMWYNHTTLPLEIVLVPTPTHVSNVIIAMRNGWLDCVCCCKQ